MFDRQACWEGAVKNCIINGDKRGRRSGGSRGGRKEKKEVEEKKI